MTRPLPLDLGDAYAWVEAAGELGVLRQMSRRGARRYATACAGNFDGEYPWHRATVTRDDVCALWAWLTAEGGGGQCSDSVLLALPRHVTVALTAPTSAHTQRGALLEHFTRELTPRSNGNYAGCLGGRDAGGCGRMREK